MERGLGGCSPSPPPPQKKQKFKRHRFCRHVNVKLLFGLLSTKNQLLKSADDWNIRILKNKKKTYNVFDEI